MSSMHVVLVLSVLSAVAGLSLRASSRRATVARSRSPQTKPAAEKASVAESKQALAAPWMKPLKKALNHGGTQRKTRDRADAKRKQLQLATVDPATGRPAVRTIVFRGFLPRTLVDTAKGESSCLMFCTDTRADKIRHLKPSVEGSLPPVECCWWLDEPGVQFRISGHALVATAHSEDVVLRAAVEEVWARLGPSTRRTFFWPQPGAPRAAAGTASSEGDESLDAAHFALLIVVPDAVDELHLGGNQKRIVYWREGHPCTSASSAIESTIDACWFEEAVNP